MKKGKPRQKSPFKAFERLPATDGGLSRVCDGFGVTRQLTKTSGEFIDAVLMDRLGVPIGQKAPYRHDDPRHATVLRWTKLGPDALRYFSLGFTIGSQKRSDENITKKSERVIGDNLGAKLMDFLDIRKIPLLNTPIIGVSVIKKTMVIAAIESDELRQEQLAVGELVSSQGVSLKKSHELHVTLGHADKPYYAEWMQEEANEYLVGQELSLRPWDVYTRQYTDLVRPVGIGRLED